MLIESEKNCNLDLVTPDLALALHTTNRENLETKGPVQQSGNRQSNKGQGYYIPANDQTNSS